MKINENHENVMTWVRKSHKYIKYLSIYLNSLKYVLDAFETFCQHVRRKPLSSVDPVAQEHAIHLACSDAGIKPSELTVVELHGTGTPLGDPVEVSALARTA